VDLFLLWIGTKARVKCECC